MLPVLGCSAAVFTLSLPSGRDEGPLAVAGACIGMYQVSPLCLPACSPVAEAFAGGWQQGAVNVTNCTCVQKVMRLLKGPELPGCN